MDNTAQFDTQPELSPDVCNKVFRIHLIELIHGFHNQTVSSSQCGGCLSFNYTAVCEKKILSQAN